MSDASFSKILSANDLGLTGGHQAGILVPKGAPELLAFFPRLDPAQENPSSWIEATDEAGVLHRLRYVYYNKKLHGTGTRDEYRVTHLTAYLRDLSARPGDALMFSGQPGSGRYSIRLERAGAQNLSAEPQPALTGVVRLSGWRQVH